MAQDRVDVHILVLHSTDRKLLDECLESLEDEPVNVHITDGIQGHIGKARCNGFQKGDSPYVCCVDPDDLVLSGAFQACLEVLTGAPEACGAYTDELIMGPDGEIMRPGVWSGIPWNPLLQLEPKYLHHIFVMRREYVERCYMELLRWSSMAEYILKGLLVNYGKWVHVNRFGYKWRMGTDTTHTRISATKTCAAKWRVIPSLQRAAERYGSSISADKF